MVQARKIQRAWGQRTFYKAPHEQSPKHPSVAGPLSGPANTDRRRATRAPVIYGNFKGNIKNMHSSNLFIKD